VIGKDLQQERVVVKTGAPVWPILYGFSEMVKRSLQLKHKLNHGMR
jgi:hypothetical protein